MSITSFDHFIETLENVPAELQRNFNMMADLDSRKGEMVGRINECVRDYWKSCKKEERIVLMKESMDLFEKAKGFAEDKVELAMQTYDLVDKQIRRLEGISVTQPTGDTDEKSGSNNQNQDSSNREEASTAECLAMDMPLDPNEPKYCTCHQVSFGEMIACDNKDCPIEWFHFACVDLKSKPKGKWYCPECFNINKKGKHKFKRQRL